MGLHVFNSKSQVDSLLQILWLCHWYYTCITNPLFESSLEEFLHVTECNFEKKKIKIKEILNKSTLLTNLTHTHKIKIKHTPYNAYVVSCHKLLLISVKVSSRLLLSSLHGVFIYKHIYFSAEQKIKGTWTRFEIKKYFYV